MKFDVIGEKGKPVVVMLTGSFCPGECLKYIYSQMQDYYIIVPSYNGHYKDSKDFTTRQNEAKEIKEYLIELGIDEIQMIYGQSMGSEVGMELHKQLSEARIKVHNLFFDGAPMIRLFKDKTLEEAMNMRFLKQFAGSKINSLKPMLESLVMIAPYVTKTTIKNEVECCYTFDYPPLSDDMQTRTHFFYGEEEKAYKTCYKLVQQAYPKANFYVKKEHGHMTYSCEHTEEYVKLLKDIIKN